MLTENKFSKYLLYAIGEIVLVVIGILIALSINNWNETNKQNKQEKNLLVLLNEDFQENKVRIEKTLKYERGVLKNSKALIKVMLSNNQTLDYDSIANMVGRGAQSWWRAEYVTGTYDAILGSGNISILKNDNLKRILAEFSSEVKSGFEDHDESISYMVEFNKQIAQYTPHLLLDSQYKKLGLTKNSIAISESANSIINNKICLGLLVQKTILEENRIDYQIKIQGYIEEVLKALTSEINNESKTNH